jgi:hypothetical protein
MFVIVRRVKMRIVVRGACFREKRERRVGKGKGDVQSGCGPTCVAV